MTEETERGGSRYLPRQQRRGKKKAIKDWEEDKCQEAADLMTLTISRVVKRKLTELEFQ